MTPESPSEFNCFQETDLDLVRVPEAFFTRILPEIDSLIMLRLLLYFFWHFENQRGNVRFLKFSDLVSDPTLIKMIGDENILNKTLDSLVKRDILLQITPPGQSEMLYFINGPQGRAAVQAIKNGEWDQEKIQRTPIQMTSQRPNIFRLYEENIGPITPLMAEILKEDEKTYPDAWIPEAIEIAVTRNARNWKYVQAVLERWQKEGRGNEQNRRDDSQDPNRYRKSWLGRE